MRCAIYTRVSTDNQAEKEYNSCEAQEEKIKAFIRSQDNLKLCKVYSDPGFSGASLDRPALKELLNDITDGKMDCILTYKIDRLTRSPKDFYTLIELFDKYGVALSIGLIAFTSQEFMPASDEGSFMARLKTIKFINQLVNLTFVYQCIKKSLDNCSSGIFLSKGKYRLTGIVNFCK
ncbi:MAG: recombinase family protein [bacterium]